DSDQKDELFGNLPNAKEFTAREMLMWEKELLGLYVTGRPIDKFKEALAQLNAEVIAPLKDPEVAKTRHDKPVMIAGEIAGFRKTFTAKGDAMVILSLEDWHDSMGVIDVVFFPRTWAKIAAQIESGDLPDLQIGEVVKIVGKIDAARDRIQVIGDNVTQNFTVMASANGQRHVQDDALPVWAQPESHDAPPTDSTDPGRIAAAEWSPLSLDAPIVVAEPWVDDDDSALPPSLPPRWVVINFPRSAQPERDERRLKRLYDTLCSYPGTDHFLILVEYDGKTYEMDFPNQTTDSHALPLQDELIQMVGQENITVYNEDELTKA
ncbi:MAG: hypothetical protein H7Y11_06690, partial [Armatimonadetes bacterium]|nr:hypothetical protein [Anaerolineae bacterium]